MGVPEDVVAVVVVAGESDQPPTAHCVGEEDL